MLGALAAWQMREGSLDRLLGAPPVDLGERIYPDFEPENVARISLRSGDTEAVFVKTPSGWVATTPWEDRMDYRATLAILTLANTTLAVDRVERDKLDPAAAGLVAGFTEVTCEDSSGEKIAHFRLGRRAPWLHLTEGENPQSIPTTYLLPLERGRKSHVYAATGDLSPLFKDGFRRLRDHRPFQFNPLALGKIRIRTAEGELTLGRADPSAPWRIIKPLDLATDPAAVKTLLEGLFELQATKIAGRSEVTLPSVTLTSENSQIALTHFGAEEEAVLDILPAETPEARETLAIVSDRPNTVFTLPLKAETEIVSIADLPLTVNGLRDPTLTNLNIASIRGIAIETATTPTILISREPPSPWTATIAGKAQAANEQRLFDLLLAVTGTRALSFETDAASDDLSPWGLDRPILTLIFLAENNQTLSISFGLDKRGGLFAKRKTSPTVMRIDKSFLEKIAVNAHDWRHARLWSFYKVDLTKLTLTQQGSPPLELSYDDRDESWKAAREGKDVTADLDPARANFILTTLENLSVARWLAPNDEAAAKALANPILTFTATENTVDDFGEINGSRTRTLTFATDPASKLIYGKLSTDPSPFTLDDETFLKLGIPPLDE
ncbi:MAG: hypothetical protein RLZZ505_752 [Verrucomicrobiota bacterium]|jgi:hypothetical protein